MSDILNLEPCPFCGYSAMNVGHSYLTCGNPKCWAQKDLRLSINGFDNYDDAVMAWNARAYESGKDASVLLATLGNEGDSGNKQNTAGAEASDTLNRCREEFEAWCAREKWSCDKGPTGRYLYPTAGRWAAWQEAWKYDRGEILDNDALVTVTAALLAAISLLENSPKSGAASNKMFDIMLSDYRKALEIGRKQLNVPKRESGGGWQPIETAPKDGSFIMLGTYKNGICLGLSNASYASGVRKWFDGSEYLHNPTHWMPLPESPKIEGGQS